MKETGDTGEVCTKHALIITGDALLHGLEPEVADYIILIT